ncbi:GerMN domain-containing protein [Bacillus sp. JJ1764]|uniref:GerMN domain-containing protein n=1 Tax=Bacillus sp. JJ1764 TaxID=3122964 RepID=UPI002FFFE265
MLTFWVPDAQAQFLVPISMIVKNAKDQSWVDIFKEKMKVLKETDLGLTDYYPLNADMSWDEKQNALIVDVPTDHQYGQGSTNEISFLQVLKKDVASNSNITKIILSTGGKPGIEFGNYGTIDHLDVQFDKQHAYFFYFPNDGSQPLLTPSTKPYSDVHTALDAMRKDQPIGLKSPLAQTIQIDDVSLTDHVLYVSINGDQKLQDSQLATKAFEALLLTAKEFGADKVVVKNSSLKHLGPFDLLKENKVPLAPNLNE